MDLVIQGKDQSLPSEMDPASIAALKFCPMTSVDVERSFSQFKHVFSDRRQSFIQENLAQVVIASYFYAGEQ